VLFHHILSSSLETPKPRKAATLYDRGCIVARDRQATMIVRAVDLVSVFRFSNYGGIRGDRRRYWCPRLMKSVAAT
jgi:hypothetical protein